MRPLVAVVAIVIILAALHAAASVVVPLLLATTLAIAFQPISDWLSRRGWPPVVSAVATALGVLAFLAGASWLLWRAGADLMDSMPAYEQALAGAKHDAISWLGARGMDRAARSVAALDVGGEAQGMITSGVLSFGGMLSTLFMVLVTTAFIQLEAASYRRKLVKVLGSQRPVRHTQAALRDVQRYLVVKVALSVANGVLLGLWCWIFGVHSPLLWGVLAFALNFIPVIGSIVAAIPPVLLALLDLGVGGALGVASGYVLVNLLVDNMLEPRIMGRALGLSPLVVLLSMLVWGFVLGPVGALLSVPLTMAVKIVLERNEDLRWLAVLLGDASETTPIAVPPATLTDVPARADLSAPHGTR